MDVFVTGGTGVLGRPVIRLLLERGDQVRALAHTEHAGQVLSELGARPVHASLFDAASLREAAGQAQAILHLATRIPPINRVRHRSAWLENDRIRGEGTHNLIEAALEGSADVVVYPSIVLLYPDSGDRWIDAATSGVQAGTAQRSTLDAEARVSLFTEAGRRGVSVRLGTLYGPESSQMREVLQYARRGFAAVIGRGSAYQASLWVDDAARALVAAMDRAPAGVYDVVDDDPLPRQEVVQAMARAVGRKRLWQLPALLMRLSAGRELAEVLGRSQRVRNGRFKAVTGWAPQVASAREGWPLLASATIAPTRTLAGTS